jgi:hypothetical protein
MVGLGLLEVIDESTLSGRPLATTIRDGNFRKPMAYMTLFLNSKKYAVLKANQL